MDRARALVEEAIEIVHGWGLSSDMWEYQLPVFVDRGLRCVAYDRRGCGRSDQPGDGYDFDTLADDLAAVLDHLDLRDATLVAHSMGSAEVARYLTRHEHSSHWPFVTHRERLNEQLVAFAHAGQPALSPS